MVTKSPDETAVRQYLLGILSEPISEEVEQKLAVDNEFAETVELIEDELIDDFLDGGLNRTEQRALENHFLQAPEHRRKLEFARLLRSHLSTIPESRPRPVISWLHVMSSYPTASAAFSCLLAVAVGLAAYTAKLQQELASETAKNRIAETALQASQNQAQARIAALEKQLNDSSEMASRNEGPLVLDLLAPVARDTAFAPSIECNPEASSIKVHIPLVDVHGRSQPRTPATIATVGEASSYSAALFGPGGKKLWSKADNRPVEVRFGEQLAFTIPNSPACHQKYSLVITPKGGGASTAYAFSIR